MALWTYWPDDALPSIPRSDGFDAKPSTDLAELCSLTGLERNAGRRRAAAIGELDVAFHLSTADRYLWDFQTLPEWRGRGLTRGFSRASSDRKEPATLASGSSTHLKTSPPQRALRKPVSDQSATYADADGAPRRGLLRVQEAAAWLGLSKRTTYELLSRGEIESVQIGRSRRIAFTALERYVERLSSGFG